MIHTDLGDHFTKTNNFVRYQHFDPTYIDNLTPFERDIHIRITIADIEKKRQEQQTAGKGQRGYASDL